MQRQEKHRVLVDRAVQKKFSKSPSLVSGPERKERPHLWIWTIKNSDGSAQFLVVTERALMEEETMKWKLAMALTELHNGRPWVKLFVDQGAIAVGLG